MRSATATRYGGSEHGRFQSTPASRLRTAKTTFERRNTTALPSAIASVTLGIDHRVTPRASVANTPVPLRTSTVPSGSGSNVAIVRYDASGASARVQRGDRTGASAADAGSGDNDANAAKTSATASSRKRMLMLRRIMPALVTSGHWCRLVVEARVLEGVDQPVVPAEHEHSRRERHDLAGQRAAGHVQVRANVRDGRVLPQRAHLFDREHVAAAFVDRVEDRLMDLFDLVAAGDVHPEDVHEVGVRGELAGEDRGVRFVPGGGERGGNGFGARANFGGIAHRPTVLERDAADKGSLTWTGVRG